MDRRQILKASLATIGTTSTLLRAATPSQVEGPFNPFNLDNDLRRHTSNSPFAKGQQIEIKGVLTNSVTREVIPRVMIEIWQADHQGKYQHPHDSLPKVPDQHFQFWGRTFTDGRGGYHFLSIKPGSYPVNDQWSRPPHVHFRLSKRGYYELTTQLYFADEELLNQQDRLLQQIPPSDQKKLIVDFEKSDSQPAVGIFDLELDPVPEAP